MCSALRNQNKHTYTYIHVHIPCIQSNLQSMGHETLSLTPHFTAGYKVQIKNTKLSKQGFEVLKD